MIDFHEKKAIRDGVITPKASLEHTLRNVDKIERVISVIKTSDGAILVASSDGSSVEALGLLECAKVDVINDMYEDQ